MNNTARNQQFKDLAYLLLSSLCLASAWLIPGSTISAGLTWLSMLLLFRYLHSENLKYSCIWLSWIIALGIAFYWAYYAIADLSELSSVPVSLIFFAFLALNALQFVAFTFLHKNLPSSLDNYALRGALAWVAVEILPIKIFPWQLGHTQLAFLSLSQVAELAGVTGISFLVVWLSEAIYLGLSKSKINLLLTPGLLLILACVFGEIQIAKFSNQNDNGLSVALIQTKISTPEHSDHLPIPARLEKLVTLSEQVVKTAELLIWPETAMPHKVHESVFHIKHDLRLPRFSKPIALFAGAQTYRLPHKLFNSAVLINPDGSVPLPYHKQALIPFGEYIPYEDYLPFLRIVNPAISSPAIGLAPKVFTINRQEEVFRFSPLICYEDILPALARESVKSGAEFLVSLSNDSWLKEWGKTALYQHQLMASFRSIENRRFLLRVGSTGLTAIFNAYGKNIAKLEPYSEAVLTQRIYSYKYRSFYTSTLGDKPWYILAGLVWGVAIMLYSMAASAVCELAEQH